MQETLINPLFSIVSKFVGKHCKLKLAKITNINGKYADIDFFARNLTPMQNIPFIQGNFSHAGNCGVIVPYNVGNCVIVAVPDELEVETVFEKSNKFDAVQKHNLGNAVILCRFDTRQEDTETFNGVLIYKSDLRIELTEAGIKITKNGVDLKSILTNLITEIQNITVTDPQTGSPLPINNASAFASIITDINNLFS